MNKWLSVELSLLLLVSMVAFAGFVSFYGSSDDSLTGEFPFGSSSYRSPPPTCAKYGAYCIQSQPSYSYNPFNRPSTPPMAQCPSGTSSIGGVGSCRVCCKQMLKPTGAQIIKDVKFSNALYTISDKPAGDFLVFDLTNTGSKALNLIDYGLGLNANGMGSYSLEPSSMLSLSKTILSPGETSNIKLRATPTAPLFGGSHCGGKEFGIALLTKSGMVETNFFSTFPKMKLICQAPTSGCTDSDRGPIDNGLNYFVQGVACEGKKCFVDYCQSSTDLSEEDCGYENGVVGSIHNGLGGSRFICPKGCKDGACIQ